MNYLSNTLKNKRAIIYTRVSTEDQADKGYSLPDQERQLKNWCEQNEITIVAHFKEEGASAKNFDRPQFKKFLDLIDSNKDITDFFLVIRWDRFSRNIEESFSMIKRLKKKGIIANATNQWINHEDPNQLYMLSIYLTGPQVENMMLAIKVNNGMRQAKREGRWITRAPFGYKLVPDETRRTKKSQKSQMVIDEPNAQLVREAFAEAAKGIHSLDSIRKRLAKKGLKCQRANFTKMLRNLLYIGKIPISEWNGEKAEISQGLHDPIISEELFLKVQRSLDGVRKTRVRNSTISEMFPLKGFFFCIKCNKLLTASCSKGRNGKKHPYYHCQKSSCKSRFSLKDLHLAFDRLLRGITFSSEIVSLYHEIVKEIFKTKNQKQNLKKEEIAQKIKEEEAQLLKVELKFSRDEIGPDTFKRLKDHHDKTLLNLKAQKSNLIDVETNYSKYLSFGFSLLSNLDFYYKNAPFETKQKLIGSIFGKDFIFDGEKVRTTQESKIIALLARLNKDLSLGKNAKNRLEGRFFKDGGLRWI